MKHLIFKVNSQSLQRLDSFKPAAGSVDYLTATFEFSSDWSGTTKTAKCRTGSVIYDAVISSDGSCVIPWDVLAVDTTQQMFGKQDFYIWVEGINGTKTITTDEIKIELNVQGAGSEQNAGDPTESVYAQYIADVTAATKASADTATAKATEAEASAENAAASAASLKNDYSNALKGNASGAVVRVDDVSPVEHLPVVKVRGKNFCKTNNIEVTGDYPWANKFLDEVIHLKAGKYTFSCDFEQTGTQTQVSYSVRESASVLNSITSKSSQETSGSIVDTFEVKKDTDVKIVLYCNITANEIDTACTFSNIQLEAGTARTEFNEWLDPSTTTLACRGKNILPITSMLENQTNTGVTVKREGNTFIFNGTATDDCVLFNSAFCRYGATGEVFTLSVDYLAGTMNGTASACVGDSYTDTEARNSWANVSLKTVDNSYAYTMQKNFIKDMWFYVRAGTVFSSYSIKVQLEKGSKATDYENYKCVEYAPNADGIVDSFISTAPTMTLLTDTNNTVIDCEYNRDINKVIADIYTQLAGG